MHTARRRKTRSVLGVGFAANLARVWRTPPQVLDTYAGEPDPLKILHGIILHILDCSVGQEEETPVQRDHQQA